MKKIMNEPGAFVSEVIEGLLRAYPDDLAMVEGDERVLIRTRMPADRVGIVTGGGSGHIPLFLGYVGDGLCTAVAIGNVFSSPSVEQVAAATMASDRGRGVLHLIGNYGGDVMNFGMAADECEDRGVSTRTVLGTDDVLSAPSDRAGSRRGVAGIIFAYKCAGAAAARGDDLDEVARIAQKAVDATRTAGVGLSPTILPTTGRPSFDLADGEMEFGIGIHGEPGIQRGPLEPADRLAERLFDAVAAELALTAGSKVAVLVNGLGATPAEELLILFRSVWSALEAQGVLVAKTYIGEYATSLEMAGASLSILKLDDELLELLDAPSHSPLVRL